MGLCEGKPYVLDDKDLKWFSQNTELSEDDVKTRYEQFVQSYPEGKIPKEVFINLLQSSFNASNRMSKIQVRGLENYTYETYDRDGDGYIDFKEFLSVMYILSNETPKQKLELVFKTFDSEGNGVISLEEVKLVVKDFFKFLSKY